MKKRFSLTLTKETVEGVQAAAKSMKLPASFVSDVCDHALTETLEILQKVQSRGSFGIADLFAMIGEHFEEAGKDIEDAAKRQEEKKA